MDDDDDCEGNRQEVVLDSMALLVAKPVQEKAEF
jgi:hypothetical protein